MKIHTNMIDNLVKKLCPNGVEFWKLGKICEIEKGKQLNKELLSEKGKYPAYNGGISYSGFTDNYNYTENTIIISQGGASAGFVNFVTTKFYANAHCYVVLPKKEIVENRYIYHFLKLNQEKLTEKQHGAGIPALRINEISDLLIPIPPLEVQEEIVKILDKFTELEAELETELEARKHQYEYYQKDLFDFKNDFEIKTLGDIYDFQYGDGNIIPTTGGEFPVYGSNGIVGSHDKYNSEDAPVIGHIGAYAGIVNWAQGKHFVTYNGVICKIKPDVNPRFGYHLLVLQDFRSKANTGSQPFVSYDMLKKTTVKIPSISMQNKIANTLDKFDLLLNDISIGLPAELKARRKQYEYYRNKLLTFKEYES